MPNYIVNTGTIKHEVRHNISNKHVVNNEIQQTQTVGIYKDKPNALNQMTADKNLNEVKYYINLKPRNSNDEPNLYDFLKLALSKN